MSRNDLLNRLLQNHVRDIMTWTEAVRTRRAAEPQGFNWLGLAEVASSNALQSVNRAESLNWASVAVSAYEELMSHSVSQRDALSYLNSVLNLIAQMILRHGQIQEHEVLNVDYAQTLFDRHVPMAYDEARNTIAMGGKLNLDQMRRLRQVKNLLSALAPLGAAGYLNESPDLQAWLLLLPQLP